MKDVQETSRIPNRTRRETLLDILSLKYEKYRLKRGYSKLWERRQAMYKNRPIIITDSIATFKCGTTNKGSFQVLQDHNFQTWLLYIGRLSNWMRKMLSKAQVAKRNLWPIVSSTEDTGRK